MQRQAHRRTRAAAVLAPRGERWRRARSRGALWRGSRRMTDMAAPSMIAQIIREHDGVVVRRIVRAIEQRHAAILDIRPKPLGRRCVGPDLVEVAAAEFGEARGLVTEPF